VASQRIANTAKRLGLANIIISDGASEKALTITLKELINK